MGTSSIPVPNILAAWSIEPHGIATFVFFLVLFFWVMYSLMSAYHWLRYGHSSRAAVPALVVHVLISAGCLLFAATGLVTN